MLNELKHIHHLCTVPAAKGAFYFLLKINTRQSAMQLVERLIQAHHVAAIPASAFGIDDGCYLRVAYGALERKPLLKASIVSLAASKLSSGRMARFKNGWTIKQVLNGSVF